MLLGYLATPFIGVLLGQLTDAAIAGAAGTTTWLAVALAVLLVCELMMGHFAHLYHHELGERQESAIDRDLLDIAHGGAGLRHFDDPGFVDALTLLRQDVHQTRPALEAVLQLLGIGVQLTVTTIVLAFVDPWLALLPAAALPPVLLSRHAQDLVDRARRSQARRIRTTVHLMDLAASADAVKEIRLTGADEFLLARQDADWAATTSVLGRAHHAAAGLRALGQVIFGCAYGGTLLIVVQRAERGDASIGDVVLLVTLAVQVSTQVAGALGLLGTLQAAGHTVRRLDWLRRRAAVDSPPNAPTPTVPPMPTVPAPAAPASIMRRLVARRGTGPRTAVPASRPPGGGLPDRLVTGVRLLGVTVRYAENAAPALRDVTLTIPAGATVAVVGENGAGKSTLVKLLCGFYQPSAGRLLVDDVELTGAAAEQWRSRMSTLFQDFARLQLTLRENVGVGHLPSIGDDTAISVAISAAGAEAVTQRVPGGLDGLLGRDYGDGAELSGGQWQRLGLARAFMRPRPLLVALDEPAAALDARAEHALFQRFKRVARSAREEAGAVTLFVSHRLSTVREADLIIVLDHGRVVELGDHGQLMARDGLYAELFRLQARAYR
ncbi:ABC transporter ATP-binding protein [Micromonospora craterilacus]|uniref:ABC transporter ATP-binding protein n=2 Tax=Micromonospora craterilacus TaxID=1655439 RepID=A0A2W2E5C5_9ACTN|nr:ABC transporter ATP-binding protein [Micromonospora craterilacus]